MAALAVGPATSACRSSPTARGGRATFGGRPARLSSGAAGLLPSRRELSSLRRDRQGQARLRTDRGSSARSPALLTSVGTVRRRSRLSRPFVWCRALPADAPSGPGACYRGDERSEAHRVVTGLWELATTPTGQPPPRSGSQDDPSPEPARQWPRWVRRAMDRSGLRAVAAPMGMTTRQADAWRVVDRRALSCPRPGRPSGS